MKNIYLIMITALLAHADAGIVTTVKIPSQLHYRYEFVPAHEKSKNQTIMHQELAKLAPMKEKQIRHILESDGWTVDAVHVEDIKSYLVYSCVVHRDDQNFYRLILDPTTAETLAANRIQKFH